MDKVYETLSSEECESIELLLRESGIQCESSKYESPEGFDSFVILVVGEHLEKASQSIEEYEDDKFQTERCRCQV